VAPAVIKENVKKPSVQLAKKIIKSFEINARAQWPVL
jgi:hypothetical protein